MIVISRVDHIVCVNVSFSEFLKYENESFRKRTIRNVSLSWVGDLSRRVTFMEGKEL